MNLSFARLLLGCVLSTSLSACDTSVADDDDDDTDTGGDNMVVTGIWNRYGSEYGYQTDIAYGGIAGQSSDRVYMCELPGSPSAGLYKGRLISPRMIRWDANHNLPDYEVVFEGTTMRFKPQNGTNTFLGQYRQGTWTPGACDFTLKDGELIDNSSTAYVVFDNSGEMKINSVKIGGEGIPVKASAETACSVTTLIPPGTGSNGDLTVSISYSGVGVNGPYSRTQTQSMYRSDFKPGCNKLAVEFGCGALAVCVYPVP
ncbi:hypothetical protein D7Y13_12405 [Corallococcus praedator]|uniref:Lipoprotein n=1 Tax=Corallococcus praedator TaxID=2316724 RepID=A0ABX9QJS5_9BACT|nr:MULTISPECIES: hypothetical protein [Corallococcus]RKH18909.1 hypothetical protein D7X74_08370 [Corallococcus sp. CA047B]RKH36048.1 hypothetical protein D7X75_02270 [Corallococcus sp. CA031C]RKI10613.1 hypothetical protein D7Y13_12405 [Corallococcus praedator]